MSSRTTWNRALIRVSLATNTIDTLVRDGRLYGAPKLSPDGARVAVMIGESGRPADLWLGDALKFSPKRRVESNPQLASRALPTTQLVEYLDADGRAQFGVLTVLQAHPGMGQSDLARSLGFDKVTVLRILRGLGTRGLVARSATPDSRRGVSVSLTAEGLAMLERAQKPAERAYKRLLAPLDKEQQVQLLDLLQLLTGELEEDARAAFVRP